MDELPLHLLPDSSDLSSCDTSDHWNLGNLIQLENNDDNEKENFEDIQCVEVQDSNIDSKSIPAVNDVFPKIPDSLEESKEFYGRQTSLENWYIRVSWAEKLKFLTTIVSTMNSSGIVQLINYIGPPTKDMLYSYSQYTNSLYDAVPFDDNRTFTTGKLQECKNRDSDWLKSLPHKEKLNIIIALLKIGGGALQGRIYKIIYSRLLKEEEERLARIAKELAEASEAQQAADGFQDKKAKRKKKETEAKDPKLKKQAKPTPAAINVKKKMTEWEKLLRSFQKLLQTPENENKKKEKKKKKDEVEDLGVDQVELFPLWVNRPIFRFLDKKTMLTASKVSAYWKEGIEASKKELKIRSALDKAIMKIEAKCALPLGLRTKKKQKEAGRKRGRSAPGGVAKPGNAGLIGRPRSSEARLNGVETEADSGEKGRERIATLFPGVEGRRSLAYSNPHTAVTLPDSFSGMGLRKTSSRSALRSSPGVTPMPPYTGGMAVGNRTHYPAPSIAVNKRWLAVSSGSEVFFRGMMTGSKIPFRLVGHDEPITAMAFHPENDYLFTASVDTTVRGWEVWTQRDTLKYTGHLDAVVALSVNGEYLASVGLDCLVKVFNWRSCKCQWTTKEESPGSCVSLTIDGLLYVGTSAGQIHVYNFLQKTQLADIDYAHVGEVTCLSVAKPLLATSGTDGYVRIWNSQELGTRCMVSMKHPGGVNGVVLSRLKVITVCEDGDLYVWDATTEKLLRKIPVNMKMMPVVDLKLVEYGDHSKIVVCHEGRITILNFPYQKKTGKKKVKPKLKEPEGLDHSVPDTNWTNKRDSDKKINETQRKLKGAELRQHELRTKWCARQEVRDTEGEEITQSILHDVLVKEDLVLAAHPRRLACPNPAEETKDRVRQLWDVVEDNPKFKHHSPKVVSYKDTLPIYNPYKYYYN